jgi:hypothetical protein
MQSGLLQHVLLDAVFGAQIFVKFSFGPTKENHDTSIHNICSYLDHAFIIVAQASHWRRCPYYTYCNQATLESPIAIVLSSVDCTRGCRALLSTLLLAAVDAHVSFQQRPLDFLVFVFWCLCFGGV